MEAINRESKTSVHFQLNYLLTGPWRSDAADAVNFQQALLDHGLDFSQTSNRPGNFILTRTQPWHLQVKLDSPGPQISGITVMAANPGCDMDMFARDASSVTAAYRKTWPAEQCQIIRTQAKIQHLYSSQTHAFKYLWENRLGQSPQDFKSLGKRPVAGGGLRLLIPPHAAQGEEPRSIEIRIESFLREPTKLLIETMFIWPKPRPLTNDQGFTPAEYLSEVEQFATGEVWTFLTQNPGEKEDF